MCTRDMGQWNGFVVAGMRTQSAWIADLDPAAAVHETAGEHKADVKSPAALICT